MKEDRTHVCPVERAGSLDSKIRKWLQNPGKILRPYLRKGMKALDVGCGPGFFSIEMAKMIGETGKVYSVDLQEGMLDIIRAKVRGTELEKRISEIKCSEVSLNVPEKVDFILAFYMVHEVSAKENFFNSLKPLLNEKGQFLLVEPKFHVTKKDFNSTITTAEKAGFKVTPGPKLTLSRAVILTN